MRGRLSIPITNELLNKQSKLRERIQILQAKEHLQKRKDNTRKKILAGSYLLNKHQRAKTIAALITELDGFLFRKTDRALFGLPPRTDAEKV